MDMLVRPSLHYRDVPYHYWLWHAAESYPEQVALDFEGKALTFREMEAYANGFANCLRNAGVQDGDRVVVMMGNRPESIFAVQGSSIGGAAFVLFSPAWKRDEAGHAWSLANAKAVIADAAGAAVLDEIVGPDVIRFCVDPDMPGTGWRYIGDALDSGQRPASGSVELDWTDREAGLLFSSGTTGMPKAVVHTHASLNAGLTHWRSVLGMRDSDRIQLTVPLNHILGALTAACGFASGARLRLFRRFNADLMLNSIARDKITIAFVVAPIAKIMADLDNLEEYDLSSLRYMSWSATPASREIALKVTERTGVRWLLAYGCSESPVLHCNPVNDPARWRLDSAGIRVNDMKIRILKLDGSGDAEPGEAGEIVTKGPSVMRGYLPIEANNDAFTADGWYRTGDIGWEEEGGWIHVTDRLKEMVKVSGFQVAPAEVEAVLLDNEVVADCAVFGVPDADKGEVVVAAVKLHDGASVAPEALINEVADRISSYKVPGAIHFIDEIPRTASGKVLRRVLREQFAHTA